MAQTGTVKWFNPTKGFGFIVPDNGSSDVFVHISAVEKAGMKSLFEGQKLEFELQENRGKEAAANLRALDSEGGDADDAEENVGQFLNITKVFKQPGFYVRLFLFAAYYLVCYAF